MSRNDENPPVVRMTDIIDAATDLQFAYDRFNKVRGEDVK